MTCPSKPARLASRRRCRRLACLFGLCVGLVLGACRSAGMSGCFRVGPGPEDFELDTTDEGPRLLVSSARRGFSRGGALLSVPVRADGTLGGARAMPVTDESATLPPLDLHPVGISLVPAHGDTPGMLYVINKGRRRPHRIERFEVRVDELVRLDPLTDDLLVDPNDLVATRDGQIYVSNVSMRRGIRRLTAMLRGRPSGQVVHFHPEGEWRVASNRWIGFPNGLAISHDGSKLFVAAFLERSILVFPRDPVRGRLHEPEDPIGVATHPDNLTWVDANPRRELLVLAGHDSPARTALHLYASQRIAAPSTVVLVDTSEEPATTTPLFSDSGERVAAASTALVWQGHLLVSQLRRPGICAPPLGGNQAVNW